MQYIALRRRGISLGRARLGSGVKLDLSRRGSRLCSWIIKVSTSVRNITLRLINPEYIRWSEELFQHDIHATEHFGKKKIVAGFIHHALAFIEPLWLG